MGDKTGIEWTDATWNPVRGCTKVSAGCDNCYAMRQARRMDHEGGAYEGLTRMLSGRPQWNGTIRLVPELLDQPLRWKRPRKIFVNSMSDLFHPDVPDVFIDAVFAVMALAQHHIFQILTKRPGRMCEYLSSNLRQVNVGLAAASALKKPLNETPKAPWPLPNAWLGVSAEDQATAAERIPLLLETPAAVHWVSAEPLLGQINLNGFSRTLGSAHDEITDDDDALGPPLGGAGGIDWVVVGGESGPGARPIHPDWVRSLRDQCVEAGVPFNFKQWGDYRPARNAEEAGNRPAIASNRRAAGKTKEEREYPNFSGCYHTDGQVESMIDGSGYSHLDCAMVRVGKKAAGRLLDGELWDQYPNTMMGCT